MPWLMRRNQPNMPDYSNIKQFFKDNNIDIANLSDIGYQLQKNNDILLGGMRSSNVKQLRNMYVINAQDSLDDTYPLYMHFNIVDEMTKIVSIKLSFWLLPFRAYSTTVPSGGGDTTVSGGGSTSGSGGGQTSGAGGDETTQQETGANAIMVKDTLVAHEGGYYLQYNYTENCSLHTHVHGQIHHHHSVADHQHTTPDHQHATPAHAHSITFGIHEEDNSPTIGFKISKDNGKTYGAVLGTYTADVANLEIKDYITAAGSYIIQFTSTARARLSAQLTCKLDITAR